VPVGVPAPSPPSPSEGFLSLTPIRCALRNASFRSTSSCSENGSRFERMVPMRGPVSLESMLITSAAYLGTTQVLEG